MKRVFVLMIALLTTLTAAFLVACKPDTPVTPSITEGPETGVYYYDGEGDEYVVSLHDGDRFTFIVREANTSGVYTLDGETLTLTFAKESDGSIAATLKDGVITLTYDGAEMRFLLKSYHTVSFDSQGGEQISAVRVLNGKTPQKPADPVRDGYFFLGWYLDESFSSPFRFDSDIVTEDITLHARWEKSVPGQSEYTVSFDPAYDGADPIESCQTRAGRLFSLPEPSRPGHVFKGWWVSMYNDGRLSYVVNEDTVFSESTTLHAVWESDDLGSKLPAPALWVTGDTLRWNAVGAASYAYEIIGPSPFATVSGRTPSNSVAVPFSSSPAGDYTIRLTAETASTGSDNSETTVAYYRNKALARVSLFTVVSPSTLLFNDVNADSYSVDVLCGDEAHNHAPFENGSSTYFNFSNCPMREGGIRFVVTAHADGYLDSVSEPFFYDRTLAEVTDFYLDETAQVLFWTPVPEATGYLVRVGSGNTETSETVGKASYDLKRFGKGEITVSVTPVTKGYNSPKPAVYTYEKKLLATPEELHITGTIVSWTEVDGAEGYVLRVNGQEILVQTASCDLSETQIGWRRGEDYQISVRAAKGAESSAWSEPADTRYLGLGESLSYARNTLFWRYVIGAARYEVKVNDRVVATVSNGVNFVGITLDRAGDNLLAVRYYDGDGLPSEWAELTVHAYTIEFDPRSGSGADPIYAVYGDEISLPSTQMDGYTFAGWYSAPGGAASNAAKYEDTVFTETSNLVLYAYWKPAEYTVTLVYGDDGESMTSTVLYRERYQLPVPPARNGSVGFRGWFGATEGRGGQYTDQFGESLSVWNTMGEMTLYACWTEVLSFTAFNDPYNPGVTVYGVTRGPGISLVESVRIPAVYNDGPVVQIFSLAFNNCTSLTRIEIPNSITSIADDSFLGCSNLRNITVYEAEGVNPSDAAFRDSDGVLLRKGANGEWGLDFYPSARSGVYRIPEGISTINSFVFNGSSLTRIIIPSDVTLIDNGAFRYCNNLSEVVFEPAEGEEKPLTVSDYAFANCPALTNVTFPGRLSVFGETPNGSNGVFFESSALAEIHIDGNSQAGFRDIDGVLLQGSSLIYYPEGRASGSYRIPTGVSVVAAYAFYGNTALTALTVPAFVQELDDDAFYSCTRLQSVVFEGSSVASGLSIGAYAFYNCTVLSSLDFQAGSKVVSIGEYAFDSCIALQSLTFPASLRLISNYAFNFCTSITSVTFLSESGTGASLTLGSYIFNNCSGLRRIDLPAHISEINFGAFNGIPRLEGVYVDDANADFTSYEGALYTKNYRKLIFWPRGKGGDVELPDELEEIGDGVFKNNTNIRSVTIGYKVSFIGAEAFYEATSLATVTFKPTPQGTQPVPLTFGKLTADTASSSAYIGRGGNFYHCDSLTALILPDRAEGEIPSYFLCLSSYNNLEAVSLPEGITSIGEYAFYYDLWMNATESFTLPSTVTSVGNNAFMYFGAGSFHMGARVSSIGSFAFASSRIQRFDIASGSALTALPERAFYASTLSSFSFGENSSVSEIGPYAFYYCTSLGTVELPQGLRAIRSYAFYNCSALSRVVFPKTVTTVEGYAYGYCYNLTGVVLNGDVTYGENVFTGSSAISDLTLNEGVTRIPDNLLQGTSVRELSVPASVVSIGANAFAGSALERISFADQSSLAVIGNGAFRNTVLSVVALPQSVETIGANAFSDSALRSFNIPSSVKDVSGTPGIGAYAFANCTELTTITFGEGSSAAASGSLTIGSNAFLNCSSLRSITLPSNLSDIGVGLFTGCDSLQDLNIAEGNNSNFSSRDGVLYNADGSELILCLPSKEGNLEIPATVTLVRDGAFARTKLSSVTFGAGAMSSRLRIGGDGGEEGNGAFTGSTTITNITLPDRTVSIGAWAFAGCSALQTVNIPTRITEIGEHVFEDTPALRTVSFSSAGMLKTIGEYAFNRSGISALTLPEGVETISPYAFYSSGLSSIFLPKSVTEIGNYAFYGCADLTELNFEGGGREKLTIGSGSAGEDNYAFAHLSARIEIALPERTDGVEIMGKYAFAHSSGIVSVSLPASLRSIPDYTFYQFSYGASSLTSVSFAEGSSLTSIGNYAFHYNKALASIRIPASVTSIGNYAFFHCEGLGQLGFEERAGAPSLTFGDYTFASATNLGSVELPSRLSYAGRYTFADCSRLGSVKLSSSLTLIDDSMFRGDSALREVDLSAASRLVDIGAYAFAGTGLLSFTLPATVGSVGIGAFSENDALTSFTFAEGSVLSATSENMFYEDDSLNTVNFASKGSLREIGSYTFRRCRGLVSISLPATLETIGSYAFESTALGAIFFPANLRSLGEYAFYDCEELSEVSYAADSALSIVGNGAFQYCGSLTEISFPESVTSLGTSVFAYCNNLRSLTLPSRVSASISDLLENCESVEEINVSEDSVYYSSKGGVLFDAAEETLLFYPRAKAESSYVLPDGVTSIGERAFRNVQFLQNVTLNDGLRAIGDYAFEGCAALTSVKMSETVDTFGESVFSYCEALSDVTLPANLAFVPAFLFDHCSSLGVITLPRGLQYIDTYAFRYTGLTTLNIPASVYLIGTGAFYHADRLTEVTFLPGDTDLRFAEGAFQNCSLLQTIELPERLSSFEGGYVFAGCSSLREITIPSGVSSLPGYLFDGCSELKEVGFAQNSAIAELPANFLAGSGVESFTLPRTVTTVADSLFRNASKLKTVVLHEGVTAIGNRAFAGCAALQSVEIPGNVGVIGDSAFQNCYSLSNLTFVDGDVPLQIGASASTTYGNSLSVFENCSSLREIKLPQRLVSFAGENTFSYCTSLQSINIPGKIRVIPDGTFYHCSALKTVVFDVGEASLTIGSGTAQYPGYVFFGCNSLQTIDLPQRLTGFLGTSHFSGCFRLGHVGIPEGVTALPADIFRDCTALDHVNLPASLRTVGDNAFYNCIGLTELGIENGLERIGASAFSGASRLARLTLPESVTAIGDSAFKGCASLSEVSFGHRLSALGAHAFDGCSALGDVTLTNLGYIPEYAFANCHSLRTVSLASSVTEIAGYAFYGCENLTSATLGSPSTIGDSAFRDCSALRTVNVGESVERIGNNAFDGCNLASVRLGDAVEEIGEYAFRNNSEMTEISLGNALERIGQYAFYGCSSIELFTIPASLTSLESHALEGIPAVAVGAGNTSFSVYEGVLYDFDKTVLIFCPTKITELKLPDGVTQISGYAFSGTSLTSVTLGGGLVSVGEYAFADMESLETIVFSDSVESVGRYAFANDAALHEIRFAQNGSLTELGEYLFSGCISLTELDLPDSLSEIGARVFAGSSITNVEIPASVTSIGDYAFGNSGFTEITIPETVERIGSSLFENCTSLRTVVIKARINELPQYIFSGCSALETMSFPQTLTTIGSYAFSGIGMDRIDLPQGVTTVRANAFANCPSLTQIKLPDSVLTLEANAFADCTALQEINLPDNLTEIGDSLFRNCSALREIEIPQNVTSIGRQAFENCTLLGGIALGGNVTSIGVSAFRNSGISSLTMEEGLRTINLSAFAGCVSLRNVKIPDSVTTFGDSVFSGCTALETVELPSSATYLNAYMFSGCTRLRSLEIPENVTGIGQNFMSGCTQLTSIVFHARLSALPSGIFSGCSMLSTVRLPDTLTSISAGAFAGTAISELTIPDGVRYLPDRLFANLNSSSLTLHLPEGITSFGASSFAFPNSESFTLNLPETVENLGQSAFGGTSAPAEGCPVTDIKIYADGVRFMDRDPISGFYNQAYTFANLGSLQSVLLPANLERLGEYAFRGCSALDSVVLPQTLTEIDAGAFGNCTSISRLVIPEKVTSIGSGAFDGWTERQTIVAQCEESLVRGALGTGRATVTSE